MLNHNWDSPRNLHFDVPKLVLAREKSMYLELVPSEGQSQCRATIPAFIAKFLVFCYSKERVSHCGLCPQPILLVFLGRSKYILVQTSYLTKFIHFISYNQGRRTRNFELSS